jgi:hypothetical protein
MHLLRKSWFVLLSIVVVLLSGLAFLPLFALTTQSKFTWLNFAFVYQLSEEIFLPLVLR